MGTYKAIHPEHRSHREGKINKFGGENREENEDDQKGK